MTAKAMTGEVVTALESTNKLVEIAIASDLMVIGLSRNKKFLTVGGRRDHRILQICREDN